VEHLSAKPTLPLEMLAYKTNKAKWLMLLPHKKTSKALATDSSKQTNPIRALLFTKFLSRAKMMIYLTDQHKLDKASSKTIKFCSVLIWSKEMSSMSFL